NSAAQISLAGGVLEISASMTKTLGTAASNIRLSSGDSGFSVNGAANRTVTLDSAGATIAWGSSNFNPSTLILQASSANRALSLGNGLDLAGATRTISVNNVSSSNAATITGQITDTVGGAGLTKSGPGRLILNGSLFYLGATTINAGTLVFGGLSNLLS